jgi:very-short-patch-repair endonuclease
MREKVAPDLLIATVAARQHGVVSIQQLQDARIDKSAVSRRVQAGHLHRIHRGVYAVGHPRLSQEARWMAALLAYGRGAVISHRSAAELWGLLSSGGAVVDVSLPSRTGRSRRRGIRLHRPDTLTHEQTTRHKGIAVTKPVRTIADLRQCASGDELRRAVRQAEVLGLPLGPDLAPDRTRSELERFFLQLCQRNGLPMPAVNVRVGSLLVDFLWTDRRLVVETDGYRYHRGRAAFESDRDRDLKLRASGYEVIRLSHRQVMDEPEDVAVVLRDMLLR